MRNGALTVGDFRQREQGDGALIQIGRVPVFRFKSRCHPEAGLRVEFSEAAAGGDLTLFCAGCGETVCRVAVAL